MVIRIVGLLLVLAIGTAGLVGLLMGLSGSGAAEMAYTADFGRAGEDCGSGKVHLDVNDGKPLWCAPGGGSGVHFPGFTDEQNAQIAALAKDLGGGTLTDGEQARIQQRIDELAATVPDSARPRDPGVGPLSGAALAWTGAGLLAAALIGSILLFRGT